MSTSPEAAKKPVKKRPPKPRTEPLGRGKACLNCRHLKIRCDGARPVCGPCVRVPKEDECEYADPHSRTKELYETINRLKARVNELESPNSTLSPISFSQSPRLAGSSFGRSPPSPSSSGVSDGGSGFQSSPDADSDHSLLGVQEPPFAMRQMLLDQFLPHASQFGFFMHTGRFRAAAVLQLPLGHASRPSPALLCAVYLWGVHLSRSEPLVSYEAVFTRRAQQHVATELADSVHPGHRMHTIQAHVLLSTYFLRNKQFLEAEFHANGAVTLALGYNLHMIRSARPSSLSRLGMSTAEGLFPDPPRDAVEEGERIRAFWTVVCQQINLIMTVRSPNNFGVLAAPGLSIDTPWPLEIAEYELGMFSSELRGSDTVQNFVMHGTAGPTSIFALQVQASVLLQRAVQLALNWTPAMQQQAAAAHVHASAWLEARIQQFTAQIPLLAEYYDHPADEARGLALTHAFLGASLIQLHKGDPDPARAGAACTAAARTIINALSDANVPDFLCAGPAVGTLLMLACQVVLREVERTRFFRASLGTTLNVDMAYNHEEAALLVDLQNGLTTMTLYALDSPLVQYQLSKVQQKCDSLGL